MTEEENVEHLERNNDEKSKSMGYKAEYERQGTQSASARLCGE